MDIEFSRVMLEAGLNTLIQNEIETILAPLSGYAGLYDLVREPLAKMRQDLSVKSVKDVDGRAWRFLPLIVCDAICGRYEHVLPVVASLELLNTAAEVFDDIEDADSAESMSAKHGSPLAINAASTLIILAESAFTRLKNRGVDSDIIVNLIATVNSYYTTTCTGQHLDLSLTSEQTVSEEVYLKVIAMKSASVVECACHTGALLAKANRDLIELFKGFGHNLGMASQIANDIKGVTSLRDIRKRKITLPAIYALSQTDGETHSLLEMAFYKPTIEFVYTPEQIRDLLFSSGAIQYAMIRMELYKQQALDILAELERADVKVEQLRLFLE